jgi:hypothetical protein
MAMKRHMFSGRYVLVRRERMVVFQHFSRRTSTRNREEHAVALRATARVTCVGILFLPSISLDNMLKGGYSSS